MAASDQAAMERWAGLALAVSALLALIAANSGFQGGYTAILGFPIHVSLGDFAIQKPLLLWVNDGLMAIFFLLVGLEIKREFLAGELSDWRRALLPLIAACGGFALPALLFVALNTGSPQNIPAWAVPTATDIAFVVGLIAALGRLVPFSLKVFVLAIAIIDDLMAVVVIALFYTAKLSLPMLGLAGLCLAILVAFNRLGVRSIAAYMLVGIVMWALVLKSGVHATLAGVALGFVIPMHAKAGATPLEDLEHGLKPWVSFLIVPIFAFANAGVPLAGMGLHALFAPLTMGIIIGLFVGKQFGILAATWLAVRAGLSPKPAGATWLQIYGVAILCGIGFTMSLFIGSLSFSDPALQDRIRLGVIVGSLASAIVGVLVLKMAEKRAPLGP
ncbi:MAG: Na+/H+ antiporter NhaA [Beijerinckiaceae bacterium]|jgi:NhaA family Na+:H+ antiporter|nr:Na+/H+ antiporter NhaA [Beijerinckiaceae bacterium]